MPANVTDGMETPAENTPVWTFADMLASLLRNTIAWPWRMLTRRWRACDLEAAHQAHLTTIATLLPACGASLVTGFSYMAIAEAHNEFGMAARDTGLGYFGGFLLTHIIPISMAHLVVNRGALGLGMDLALAAKTGDDGHDPLDTVFFPRVLAQMVIAPALAAFGILGVAIGAWAAAQLMTDAGETFPEFCLKLFRRSGATDIFLVPAKTAIIALVTCCVAAHGGLHQMSRGESPGAVATRVMTRSVFSIIVTNAAVSMITDVMRRWL